MRKTYFFVTSLAMLALSACGGGDRDALMSAFGEAGFDEDTSACMIERAKQDMEPELYDAMVNAARSNDDSLESLSPAQQIEFATFMSVTGMECVGTSLE